MRVNEVYFVLRVVAMSRKTNVGQKAERVEHIPMFTVKVPWLPFPQPAVEDILIIK